MNSTRLELLAPARNADIAIDAILCGADAVYIGAPSFGARAAAGNSVADIARAAEFAHRFDARTYVTMNTIVYDHEIPAVESLVRELYDAGADALIVQDMAYLRMQLPPIALHASTQCDTRTPARAAMLEKAGFSQIVLARELTLDEIRAVRAATTAPLEAFVHGALCVSYSGDCHAGFIAMGRSANRGECPQMCRLPYRLCDASGRDLAPERHYLSLRDMNRINLLADMADAGISSFKIEGRLKDAAYVRSTVAAYSAALDSVAASSSGRYIRASHGRSNAGFIPDVAKVFNRGYTSYFLDTPRREPGHIASMASPKNTGERIGTVLSCRGKVLTARLNTALHNGDGLGYFGTDGRFSGFRLNKIEGNRLFAPSELRIAPGTPLYRNADKAYTDAVASARPQRSIALHMQLRSIDDKRIALSISDERGNAVECVTESLHEQANTPQADARRRTLERLGGTIYHLESLDDRLAGRFVAASALTALRRDTLDALDSAQRARYSYDRRRPCMLESDDMAGITTTYHDNVANTLASEVYTAAGATVAERAAEVERPNGETRVMTTRYCLRRELGACLRTSSAKRLPSPLYLCAPGIRYRLDFDCAACEMHVVAERPSPVPSGRQPIS
ncbi:MAG: U32 family peptidase [Muribaculaceae bacterium]|nr:U32 family peptidase [Muribaculaceae bacterium]